MRKNNSIFTCKILTLNTRLKPLQKVNRDQVLRDGPMNENNFASLTEQLNIKKKQVKRRKTIIDQMRQLLADRIECNSFYLFQKMAIMQHIFKT